MSKRWSATLALALCLALLSACAQLAGPLSVNWSEAELNQMLSRRFPLDRRMLEVLDVKVSQPVLTLLPATNRLAADLTVDALDRLFGKTFRGHLAVETALRYEPADHTLRLAEVRVTAFSLEAAGNAPSAPVQRLGAALAETVLDGAIIHRVTPEQLDRLARRGYQPGSVQVTARGLTLTAVPVP